MKAFVFHGAGQSAWEDVPDPAVKEPTDAVVRVASVTICGTELHILKGDVPEVRPGDRVLVSCITACGRCAYCRQGGYGQCHSRPWAGGRRDLWMRVEADTVTGRRIHV